jgi:ABC-type Fe3+/spermidine/putrescine transport system ATPase subunit
MALLQLEDLNKTYPDGWTLSAVNVSVARGEIVCLLGPSGCGKTTLLRLIAGLEMPDTGVIRLDGEDVTAVPPHRRDVGLMFQEYALFPHRDVFGNVAFGLRMAGLGRQERAERVGEVLELVGLSGFAHRDVSQLSGGERQRVALARSLAPNPRLLLLDEPLGSLDRAMRERLMEELPEILDRAGVTAITVTHDQEEAFALADRIVVMHAGAVVQIGAPQDVYRRPASAWMARFLGLTNLLEARVAGPERVETALGVLTVGSVGTARDGRGRLLIRPEGARLAGEGPNQVRLTVVDCSFRGAHYRVHFRDPEEDVELAFHFPLDAPLPQVGETVSLALRPEAMRLLPAEA